MKTILSAVLFITLIAGCHTYSSDMTGDVPVRYAETVRVVHYDSVTRPPSKTIQVFDSAADVKQPYHKIALVSRPGHREDESLLLNALIWRARHEGAEGVIILEPKRGWPEFLFRAHAIVFDKPTSTP